MARIRTIKPEFFRHEDLQDLEIKHPKKYPMLVFAGLWTQADANGVFPWKPRTLKLDILPFLSFDMSETLEILQAAGMVVRYSVEGKEFGHIGSFLKHQRLNGKEATEGVRYPDPSVATAVYDGEVTGKQQGSNGEATGKQLVSQEEERKGKEKEGKGEISLSGKTEKRQALTDDQFISSLKENPAYRGINIDLEIGKMRSWLMTPRGKSRKLTRGFIVNWLNRIDRPVADGDMAALIDRAKAESAEAGAIEVDFLKVTEGEDAKA